ncbi:MAG TPA: hypothetical protein PKJ21_04650 [Anaerolineae bacterium]|nr:hypothetical protein [Anaerolineae bacterium]HNT05455.1 hypothetical protein [Anaerolineae bacterium]
MNTREELTQFLHEELRYSPRAAQVAAQDLLSSQPEIRKAFDQWRATGELPELEAEGYSLRLLVEEYGLKPVGALLTLDWLMVEPEEARAAILRGRDQVAVPATRVDRQGGSG